MWKDDRGYLRVGTADKKRYAYAHRQVYEDYNKCCLLRWADVHHINGVRTDNRPENLQGIFHAKHTSISTKKDLSNRRCLICKNSTAIQYQYKEGHEYVAFRWHRHNDGFLCERCYMRERRRNRIGFKSVTI